MNKTFKKITTSITAAVLCALPLVNSFTASAAANANARYTYRTVFAVQTAKNVDLLVAGVACKSANTDAPTADKLASGTITGNGGGAPGLHAGGANFYPTNHNVTGGLISFHMHCNSPSDYKEVSITNYAYDPNGKLISNAVKALPTFLVGDLNNDKKINAKDCDILTEAINKVTNYKPNTSYKFNYFSKVSFELGGVSYSNIPLYKLDINNDGYLSIDDISMHIGYSDGTVTRFKK